MQSTDRVAIVTGAGTGLGAALTRALVSEGWNVIAVGRRIEKLEETAASASDAKRVHPFARDLTADGAVDALMAHCDERFGRLDLLVNNMGVGYCGDFGDARAREIRASVLTNLLAPMLLTHAALPRLAKSHGLLVNVNSLSGLLPLPGQAVYAGTKFGLRGFTEALQAELANGNVRILSIYPGGVDSEMNSEELRARLAAKGYDIPVLAADDAAAQVLRAMKDASCRAAVVGNPGERFVGWLARRRSPIVRAFMAFVKKPVRTAMEESLALVRARDAAH